LVPLLDVDTDDKFVPPRKRLPDHPEITFAKRILLGPDGRFINLYLDVALVVIQVPDRFRVFPELFRPQRAALAEKRKKPVLLGFEGGLDFLGGECLVSRDDDVHQLDLFALFDIEDDISVSAPQFADHGYDDRVIIPFFLVFETYLLGVFIDQLKVEGGPRQQSQSFLQLFRGQFIIAFDGDLPDQGFFLEDEDDLEPALEPFGLHLHVLKVAELIQHLDIVLDQGRGKNLSLPCFNLGQDRCRLDSPVPLHFNEGDLHLFCRCGDRDENASKK
jgi:hypothetical protein